MDSIIFIAFYLNIFMNNVHGNYPTIITNLGPVHGIYQKYGFKTVAAFLGIPYVYPPVGPLRFRMPVPLKNWTKPIYAQENAPACIQPNEVYNTAIDYEPGKSEDCLYLNIWMPLKSKKPKAVMFWLHGGKYVHGSNRMDVYDARALAGEGDIVVVVPNYRLQAAGFSYLGVDDVPGNMGFYDQMEALKWVHENIDKFGGDKNQVTIAGQSDGTVSIATFAISPKTRHMFSRMIMQSGGPSIIVPKSPNENYHRTFVNAHHFNCTYTKNGKVGVNTDCYRSIDPHLVSKFDAKLKDNYAIQFGNELLPGDPRSLVNAGFFKSSELLIGHTKDEAAYILPAVDKDYFGRFGEKHSTLNKSLGRKLINKIQEYFPQRNFLLDYYYSDVKDDDYELITNRTYKMYGDLRLRCPSEHFANKMAEKNKVFSYYFTHRPSSSPWAPWMGAVHLDDVQFIFGRPLRLPSYYQLDEIKLSEQMIKTWSSFIKTGKPHSPIGYWPLYSKHSQIYIVFDTIIKSTFSSKEEDHFCHFVNSIQGLV